MICKSSTSIERVMHFWVLFAAFAEARRLGQDTSLALKCTASGYWLDIRV